jgi:uncharacterized protein YqjF (DUF2071 family)
MRLLSRSGEPLFIANWDRALFLHYALDPGVLQRVVPLPLDLFDGEAFVSLVAFTMRGFRLRFGGRLGEWLCRPMRTQHFLNVRTYVRHRGEAGILFLTEWLSHPLCVRIGPLTYGLPYRAGRINYLHAHEQGRVVGTVENADDRGASLRYEGELENSFAPCIVGSRDEFLLERYTAYTVRESAHRLFRIWHEPWLQARVDVTVRDDELIRREWPWFANARMIGANYSPGAPGVWMGRPHQLDRVHPAGRSVLSAMFKLP